MAIYSFTFTALLYGDKLRYLNKEQLALLSAAIIEWLSILLYSLVSEINEEMKLHVGKKARACKTYYEGTIKSLSEFRALLELNLTFDSGDLFFRDRFNETLRPHSAPRLRLSFLQSERERVYS